MKVLYQMVHRNLSRMDEKDVFLLKICLAAFGLLIGLCIPQKRKKAVGVVGVLTFLGTTFALIRKFGIGFFPKKIED